MNIVYFRRIMNMASEINKEVDNNSDISAASSCGDGVYDISDEKEVDESVDTLKVY